MNLDIEMQGTRLSDEEEKLRHALLRHYRVRLNGTTYAVLGFNAADAICTLLHHMQRDEEAETGRMTIVAERICHD